MRKSLVAAAAVALSVLAVAGCTESPTASEPLPSSPSASSAPTTDASATATATATIPLPIPEEVAITGSTNPLTVVWVAVSLDPDELVEAEARVATVAPEGLTAISTPLECQSAAHEQLLPEVTGPDVYKWGVPLYYADAHDAQDAAEILGEPIAGIITGDVFCHFD
ncbi:hypothetical protein [Antribacter gilvus]|uniref:hypothetical protein n=1 Tax=Antribacter gilvus TaxID=2304675 RepID=UPI000F77D3C3|nr:hypothetical protein [Antribacter gilvus]